MKKMVVAGGSGYLGTYIKDYFKKNYEIVVLTRNPQSKGDVAWDGHSLGDWVRSIDGADVIINLSGKSVNCRYNRINKEKIISSRVQSTAVIGEAIARLNNPPKLWINASSAAGYGDTGDALIKDNDQLSEGFSPEVVKAWEHALFQKDLLETRRVALRIGMVLGYGKNSVLNPFLNIVRMGMGGKFGSGQQYITWIHHLDFVRVLEWVMDDQNLSGPINISAPYAVRNKDFLATLRKLVKMPIAIPQKKWMIRVGTMILGTEAELVLKGRNVYPEKLMKSGYEFQFGRIDQALQQIVTGYGK